ncbi:MAG: NAD-dependent dehydratase [Candidatus Melainabacteria bacterium RIFOXYA12_FULL_32_12]|nr:MAG: NAD-dependent dehydratase [Candidatus Melainabacteria bacterium RIFOXYA2_FULL_32_9]OGI30366.1 MAG: NAD-dependent dehydratase [Candidatus Melainabacteria bacterium RIFOXYA12_FULL_32_12]
MKIIVTGGAGFIGSHLVDLLLDEGHDVTVLDNFSTGRPQNLLHHKDNPNLRLIEADIVEYDKIAPYFEDIDWVFHLAALADIVPSIEKPINYHRSNVDGTVNVLQASVKHNVKRFLYAASSSCYGIPDVYPTPEIAEIRPQYPYALTKNIAEQYVMHWGKVYKLPVVALRLFNVYGTRSRTSGTYGAVFGVFLAQKLANKPFTVVGDGAQTRDFTYVTDVADAFFTAAKSDIVNEVMNVGSDDTYSVNRIVELLDGDVVYIPKRPGEPDCTYADISKIKKSLNWTPKVSIEEGVRRILENIDYWKEAPVWDKDSIQEATKTWFKYLS